MTDQLSLRLDTDLPNLPDGIRPMLPRPLAEPFDSADHLFEPSWGGLRALAFVGPADSPGAGDVRIVDVNGVDRTVALPELSGLAVRIAARSAVLDGELVVVDGSGRMDAAELGRRLESAAGRPVAFLVFDLLHLDGRSLLSWPLVRRREALRRILHAGDEVVAVPAILGEGKALHAAAVAQGIAGIMARQRTSPYLSGIRSRLWRSIPAGVVAGAGAGGGANAGPGGEANTGVLGGANAAVGCGTSAEGTDGTGPAEESPNPTSGVAPVIALIRRLPFDDEDAD